MLIINECRTCNADKATCPIKVELKKKLAGVKERLKYKCTGWQKHLECKIGDKIEFHFIENGEYGGEKSGETLKGVVVDINKKRPVYYVMIDQDNRNLIDPEYSVYDKYVQPYITIEDGHGIDHPGFYTVPVKEELICCISE